MNIQPSAHVYIVYLYVANVRLSALESMVPLWSYCVKDGQIKDGTN